MGLAIRLVLAWHRGNRRVPHRRGQTPATSLPRATEVRHTNFLSLSLSLCTSYTHTLLFLLVPLFSFPSPVEIPDFKDSPSASTNSGYGAVPQFRDASRPAGSPASSSSPPTPSASPAYGGVPGKDKIGSFAKFGAGGGGQPPTPGYQSLFGGAPAASPSTTGSPASSTTASVPSNGYGVIPESGGTSAPAVATPGYGVIPTSAAGAAGLGRARPLSTMSPEAAGYGNLPLPADVAQAGKQGGYGSVPGEPEGVGGSGGSGVAAPGGARYGAVPTGNAKPRATGGYGAVPTGR